MTQPLPTPHRDTWSTDCNSGHHQSCGGYDDDGELCECSCHDEQEREYLAQMQR